MTYLGRFEDGHLRRYEEGPSSQLVLARGGYDLLLAARDGSAGRGCPLPGRERNDATWAGGPPP